MVLAHAGAPGVTGGFVGVDVFFVLSGYLISGLLFREYAATSRIDIPRFVARRLRRLLPALLIMLLSVMALGALLLSPHEFTEQTSSAAYAATWTSNLYFAFTDFDYFNELHLRDLFLHTWSLGVEEQFYLVWPFVLLVVLYLASTRTPRRVNTRSVLIGLAVLFFASLTLSLHWTQSASSLAFYLMPSRIWQFALGAMVFLWFDEVSVIRERQVPTSWSKGMRPLGMLLIIGSAVLFHPGMAYPGAWALLPSLGAALLITPMRDDQTSGIARLLVSPLLVWIGDRSYSWYLWHWPLLMLGFAWGLENTAVSVAAIVVVSLALAAASYRWIELPIWKGRLSGTAPTPAITASVFAIIVTATVLGGWNETSRDGAASGLALSRAARVDIPAPYAIPGCDTWFRDASLQPCVLGNVHGTRTAVLLGDSIGTQWFSLLAEIFSHDAWQIVVLTKSSCAIVDEPYHYGPVGEYTVCAQWRERAIEYLSEISPDIVFIGSAATYGFSEAQWKNGTRRVLDRVTLSAGRVILIPGTPALSFDGPGCLERWWAGDAADRRPADEACREPIRDQAAVRVAEYLGEVIPVYGNVDMLNLNDLVCPEDYCAARQQSGLVVFRDQQHLTDSFVRSTAPAIAKRLRLTGIGVRTAE